MKTATAGFCIFFISAVLGVLSGAEQMQRVQKVQVAVRGFRSGAGDRVGHGFGKRIEDDEEKAEKLERQDGGLMTYQTVHKQDAKANALSQTWSKQLINVRFPMAEDQQRTKKQIGLRNIISGDLWMNRTSNRRFRQSKTKTTKQTTISRPARFLSEQ